MAVTGIPEYRIKVDQLRTGVFIRLVDVNWFTHPFLFSSFMLKHQHQIDILRKLGIEEVICIPEKSDILPLSPEEGEKERTARADKAVAPEVLSTAIDQMWQIKRTRTERLRLKKERIARAEKRYATSLAEVSKMMDGIVSGNPHTVKQANTFVEQFTEYFLSDVESTLHLLNLMSQVESIYYHALNVAVLSLMLGTEAGLKAYEMQFLGMGALFHDIGKARIEKRVLRKPGDLTRAEQNLIQMHPKYGKDMLVHVPQFPYEAINIVMQHHERMDGSGYPEKLKGEQIYKLARIVAISNAYDNHCNNADPAKSLTPYQALSYMFTHQKDIYDKELLALFIRCLGVYPPGTVVQLSNNSIGMVIAVNPANQLCPSLVVYDPGVPKREALVIDLADEPELKVEKSIRPSQLPPEIYDYLSPRTRITYYVDPMADKNGEPAPRQ